MRSPDSSQPILLVLAAGMGSRYGGLKQIAAMGPNGESVLDYSVFDAIRAGFKEVVFMIRRDIEAAFRTAIGGRYADAITVRYAFQDLQDLPAGLVAPAGRTKPWGTAHAVYAARNWLTQPFAVINADDYYGPTAFAALIRYFQQPRDCQPMPLAMVAYGLQQTLSANGSVNRGLCKVCAGLLQGVAEWHGIERCPNGSIQGRAPDGSIQQIAAQHPVSMNFWGFPPALLPALENALEHFIVSSGSNPKAEFYLPSFVDALLSSGTAVCHVLQSDSEWFGVTYPDDKPVVQQRLRALADKMTYPSPLWPTLST